jgi:hypothetical protein
LKDSAWKLLKELCSKELIAILVAVIDVGMALIRTDVSEGGIASIIRVETIREPGMLAVTMN